MEFVSEEQKIEEWHRRADEGRKRALRREKYISFFVVFVVIILVCVLAFLIVGIIEAIRCL